MLVLVKDAPETIASADVEPGDLVRIGGRCGQRTQRSGVGDALMWPVVVVEVFEFVQGAQEVLLVPDQCPVQQLMPAGLDPTLHDRIHAWHLDAAAHDLDTCVGEDAVEQVGELAVSVADQIPGLGAGVLTCRRGFEHTYVAPMRSWVHAVKAIHFDVRQSSGHAAL
jgi:hypothetical protein